MKLNWTRHLMVAVVVVVLLAGSAGFAQERQGGRVFNNDPNPAPAEPGGVGTELVTDGGFEAGTPNPNWTEASINFGTPICDVGSCGTGGGTGPNSGSWWVWFGGVSAPETGSVSQTIAGGANDTCVLSFWLEIPAASGNGIDFMDAEIDGGTVFEAFESDGPYVGYTEVTVDISAAIDGTNQTLSFNSSTSGTPAISNFFVDDVSLICDAAPVPTMPTWALSVLIIALLSGGLLITRLRLG